MNLEVVAIIISGAAVVVSIIALVTSNIHKRNESRHIFYSKLEEKISNILFDEFPKCLKSFINKKSRMILVEAFQKIDDCFSNLYDAINCLDYLDDEEYTLLQSSISDLEDCLTFLKNEGYDEDKVVSAFEKNKRLYRTFKEFSLKH